MNITIVMKAFYFGMKVACLSGFLITLYEKLYPAKPTVTRVLLSVEDQLDLDIFARELSSAIKSS